VARHAVRVEAAKSNLVGRSTFVRSTFFLLVRVDDGEGVGLSDDGSPGAGLVLADVVGDVLSNGG
jgi:hypothetical protein